MPKVITNEKIKIGAYLFERQKKPRLCVQEATGELTIYGIFNSIEQANEFMNKLAELCGAVKGD